MHNESCFRTTKGQCSSYPEGPYEDQYSGDLSMMGGWGCMRHHSGWTPLSRSVGVRELINVISCKIASPIPPYVHPGKSFRARRRQGSSLYVDSSIRQARQFRSFATAHGDNAFGASTNLGCGQAHRKSLIARSTAMRRDKHRWAMIGGAEYDRLVRADRVYIEDEAGSREKDEWSRRWSTPP